jgi:hypothetical protein
MESVGRVTIADTVIRDNSLAENLTTTRLYGNMSVYLMVGLIQMKGY